MASCGRLPLPRGGQMCAYPRLHAHCGCSALRSRSHSVQINVQARVCAAANYLFWTLLTALSDFFDREREQSLLLAKLNREPEGVLVIVGPRSSGKSRLLEEVLQGNKKHEALLAFVDGRAQKLTDDGVMAVALKEQGAMQLPEVRRMLEQMGKTAGKVADAVVKFCSLQMNKSTADLEKLLLLQSAVSKVFEEKAPSSLNDVIKAYDSLLRLESTRISNTSPLPVICIDEANVLTGWYKGGAAMEDDLEALLRFFVKVSKQQSKQTCRAHVILATSEYSFITWLTEKLGSPFFETQVIGDFPEAEARLYLEQTLGASITDAKWAQVFEVCGGNAGYLRRVSGHFKDLKDWTRALQDIWRNPMAAVVSGLRESSPWRIEQYRNILRLNCESDYAAVTETDAYQKLTPGGDQAVQAMVKANLLSYRPPSGWASDIPSKAFGRKQLPIVTAPSSAHLYCMRVLLEDGSLSPDAQAASSPPAATSESSTLKQQLDDAAKKVNSGTETASTTPIAAPESSLLRELDKQIKDVNGKISTVDTGMEELLRTKPEGWQQELAYLRQENRQLREKEKQLREEKLLLQRKADT